METYDVVVVGAGPAGSTTAQYAAKSGLSVLFIDKRKEIGVPVQCGEFMPSISEMKRIAPKVMDIEGLFQPGESMASRRTKTLDFVSPKGKRYRIDFDAYSVERKEFDKKLAGSAESAGAELRTGEKFLKAGDSRIITDKGEYKAKVIVGADGYKSGLAAQFGLNTPGDIYSCALCEVPGDYGDNVEMFFGSVAPGAYAWVIPKRDGANVGLGAGGQPPAPLKKMLRSFMKSREIPEEVNFWSGGFVPVSGPVPKTVHKNVLLVGDAAGQVMATNGGGIPIAMICGRIAGNAIAAHINDGRPLEDYDANWRKVMGEELDVALKTKRLADKFFTSDARLELAMRLMGAKRMKRAILCKKIFTGR